jgi:3-methylfumaryl-CoA hydratase
MFAGGRIRYAGQARIGQVLTRASRTLSLEEKSGRSGKLLIATHEYVIDGDGQTVIDELQNIVYRAPSARSSSDLGAHRSGGMNNFEWSLDVRIDAVTLFRFSALTYNAHRIHYDLDYAQTIEAYPGLVVQGPLQAMWLAELCRRNAPFETVESFEFRAVRPMFEGGELHLRGRKVGATANLAAFDQHGQQTVEAKVEFLPS